MRSLKPQAILLLSLLLLLSAGLIWLLSPSSLSLPLNRVLPTLLPTAALPTETPERNNAALPPTFTPVSTQGSASAPQAAAVVLNAPQATTDATPLTAATPTPTAAATRTATATPSPTIAPSATRQATAAATETRTAFGRDCVNPVPAKPAYARYFLSGLVWPTPQPAVPSSHFVLGNPFPGNGRFLINQDYPYGYDLNGRLLLHNAVDGTEPGGTPLLAVADGTVVVARDDRNEQFGWRCNWYGHLVVLELDQTWLGQPVFVLYGHVLEIQVDEGQRVVRGEVLAEVGSGGAAAVPHLHVEVRVGANEFGSTRNPLLWIDPATRGVIAGRLVDPSGRPWHGVGLSLIGHFEDASGGNTWSYLADPLDIVNVHPDEGLGENFVFGDVKPGAYDVYTVLQGVEYRIPVTVSAGQVSPVEIITEAFKTPTPAP